MKNSLSPCQLPRQILRCLASLIEDLFDHGFDLILTACFQNHSLERCFGQYRQMSGDHFLVGFKDTICSGKILKIKFLLKGDIHINKEIKSSCPGEMEILKLKVDISFLEFHWTNSCFYLIVGNLLHILQAILQRST